MKKEGPVWWLILRETAHSFVHPKTPSDWFFTIVMVGVFIWIVVDQGILGVLQLLGIFVAMAALLWVLSRADRWYADRQEKRDK